MKRCKPWATAFYAQPAKPTLWKTCAITAPTLPTKWKSLKNNMRLNTLTSFIGFVLLIAGTYSPILRPLHLFNWDVYDANKPFGIVILLVAVVGIIGAVFSQPKLVKLIAWLSLGLVVLLYIGAQVKVH